MSLLVDLDKNKDGSLPRTRWPPQVRLAADKGAAEAAPFE